MQELNMTTIMMTFNMGNQREYLSSGGFLQYLYVDHESFSPLTINGIRGKVVHYIPDGNTDHTGLPTYADTSDMYFRVDKNGNVKYTLRDAPSLTGTFLFNDILNDKDRISIGNGAVITIGATTLILQTVSADSSYE